MTLTPEGRTVAQCPGCQNWQVDWQGPIHSLEAAEIDTIEELMQEHYDECAAYRSHVEVEEVMRDMPPRRPSVQPKPIQDAEQRGYDRAVLEMLGPFEKHPAYIAGHRAGRKFARRQARKIVLRACQEIQDLINDEKD